MSEEARKRVAGGGKTGGITGKAQLIRETEKRKEGEEREAKKTWRKRES